MKIRTKITLTIFFLVFININAQELSGRVTYDVSLNLTQEEVNRRNKEKNKITSQGLIDKINNARNILAYLVFNKQHSIQTLDNKLGNDGRRSDNFTKRGTGNGAIYYTDNSFIKTNSIVECRVLGKCFLIEQPEPVWKITQESKIIGGYLCYRAIYQNPLYKYKKPIAWFAPKIPANYGPKIFTGLPGLILELEDNIVTYTAIKIEINPKEKIIITKPEGEKITKEKYEAAAKKAHPAFYKRLKKHNKS